MSNTLNTNQKSFAVHVIGDETGNIYSGEFVALIHLGNRQFFLQDQLFRQYLGGDPTFADVDNMARAKVLSEINAFCVKFPEFWVKEGAGLDLKDDNVMMAVYDEVKKIRDAVAVERSKRVMEAAEKLKATVEKAEAKVAAEEK